MRAIPDPRLPDWESAAKAQNERSPVRRGGYSGAIVNAQQTFGADRATCPTCRVDYVCPYHRTH